LLLALLVPALHDFGYRLLDAEMLVILPATALCGAMLALPGAWMPRVGRLMFVLLAVCVLDFFFLGAWYSVLAVMVLLAALAFTRFHPTVLNVATLGAAVFAVLGALAPRHQLLAPDLAASRPTVAGDAQPLLLHIVLDEQASPLTAPQAISAGGRLDRLLAAYVQRGFAARTSVRSENGATEKSLARVFGPATLSADQSNLLGEDQGFTNRLHHNELLQELIDHHYGVSVIQSSFLQLCTLPAANCHTYSRDNYGHAMRRFERPLGRRLALVATLMHTEMIQHDVRGVFLYRPLGEIVIRNKWINTDPDRNYWTRPAAMLELFDALGSRAQTMRAGEAWMVHVLLPHFPYMLDASCGLRAYSDWSLPTWITREVPLRPRLARLELDYWQQVECVHARVLGLIDQLDRRLGPGNVRVLVHGDHAARLGAKGSRPVAAQLQALEPDKSLDTLVLLRAPGVEPGVDSRREMLTEAIRRSYSVMLRAD
jgi:hypothetical protein